ncbi:autotransporter-associated beta strand repeat-containing protein, partial [Salmonella enterica]
MRRQDAHALRNQLTLTLSGANSYTGGTTISGGTLVASNVE